MLVNSLEQMERIVSLNDELEWIGWDVVRYTQNNNAMFSKDAEYRRGEWYKKKVYAVTEKGWNIPQFLGRPNEQQVER